VEFKNEKHSKKPLDFCPEYAILSMLKAKSKHQVTTKERIKS